MLRGLAGRTAATMLLMLSLCVQPALAGAGGSGSATTGTNTTTSTTTTTTVDKGNINAGTVYQGTINVHGALSASVMYAWGRLTATGAMLNQLQSSLGSTGQTAINFYRNAVGTLPSNYELLTATASNPANFLYYDNGGATGFQYPTDITDGANALGIENEVVGGRTYQWSQTTSGPSNYAFAISDSKSSTSTSTQVIKSGDIVLATNVDTLTQITNYTGTANVSVYQVDAAKYVSPIVLDLRGQGRLEASNGNWMPHPGKMSRDRIVAFDVNANGFEELMEWVGPNDGLLVEPKPDGRIDGSCLFGTTGGWSDGYEKLSLRDANHDGKLSGDELKGLCVWQDRNGNGRPDEGEVRSLQQVRITEIALNHTNYRSTFVMDGSSHLMWDWWPCALHVRKVGAADILK